MNWGITGIELATGEAPYQRMHPLKARPFRENLGFFSMTTWDFSWIFSIRTVFFGDDLSISKMSSTSASATAQLRNSECPTPKISNPDWTGRNTALPGADGFSQVMKIIIEKEPPKANRHGAFDGSIAERGTFWPEFLGDRKHMKNLWKKQNAS